ncbi:alpha-L-rhamnosidase-related protein [Salmonirosea aquatica]|uniref:alpha-L-rhamnosidase n=1 Tax=Salmonirosea aquatica TaxID=2654236 RepID=A0A7C9BDC4_9BACT|nr:Bacterial alpha-L-rhamnosidase [Cytophagaceae bacterium SJW1-29]
MKSTFLPLAFFLSFSLATAQSPAPNQLRTDLLEHTDRVWKNGFLTNFTLEEAATARFPFQTADLRSNRPYFSWILTDTSRQISQTAYQLLVASTQEKASANQGDVWDSGKVSGSQQMNIRCGVPLDTNRIYYWKVKTWDNKAQESAWSAPKVFRTARQLSDYATAYYPLVKSEDKPAQQRRLSNQSMLYDFGKDLFGQLYLTAYSPSGGDTLLVHVGEHVTADGHVHTKPGGTLRYRLIRLPLRQGEHTYAVQFTSDKRNTGPKAIFMPDYIGEVLPFRYVELVVPSGQVRVQNVTRHGVFYPFNEAATTFTSSDTTLNQIWDLSKYSIKATSFTGYYVDGDRERIPYEADALINQLSHYAVDTEFNMAKRSLDYLIYHATWPTEWSLQNLQVAYYDYLYSGDIRAVGTLYDELKPKLLLALARNDGLISTRTGKQTAEFKKSIHYGTFDGKEDLKDITDWPQPSEIDGFEFKKYNAIVNAFHYKALLAMEQIARDLGKQDDAAFYQKRAQQVRTAFQGTFIDTKAGLIRDGEGTDHASLHANMFALAFGLVPEKYHASVLAHIRSKGMATSVYGSQFLLDALYNAHESKYALSLLTSTDLRSWYNMIRTGSTLTTEAWDTSFKANQDWNHAWGAAPANLIVRKLMGVEPLTPAFGTIQIKPQPDTLRQASLDYTTLRGMVKVRFENTPERFELHTTLPANTTGVVYLPRKNARSTVYQDGKSIKATADGAFWKIESVPSGTYTWEVR